MVASFLKMAFKRLYVFFWDLQKIKKSPCITSMIEEENSVRRRTSEWSACEKRFDASKRYGCLVHVFVVRGIQ
jgi:hypothetical protein